MGTTSENTLVRIIQNRLDARVRPMLQAHGGDLVLISVSRGVVRVRFEGACVGCPLRPVTMAATVEPALRDLDEVEAVEAPGVRLSDKSRARLASMIETSHPGFLR